MDQNRDDIIQVNVAQELPFTYFMELVDHVLITYHQNFQQVLVVLVVQVNSSRVEELHQTLNSFVLVFIHLDGLSLGLLHV